MKMERWVMQRAVNLDGSKWTYQALFVRVVNKLSMKNCKNKNQYGRPENR